MKNIVPIVGINLLVLLGYSLLIHFNASVSERGLNIMIYSAELVALHIFVNLFFGIANFKTNKPLGKAWLLSSGIVLLVRFSTCLGSTNL